MAAAGLDGLQVRISATLNPFKPTSNAPHMTRTEPVTIYTLREVVLKNENPMFSSSAGVMGTLNQLRSQKWSWAAGCRGAPRSMLTSSGTKGGDTVAPKLQFESPPP